ncbi:MAG: glycerol-3-phosphate dehydrogenase, partial [Burkholderiales bacterium]
LLCEAGDLGSATSSASSKMIHGGLRYLEQYEFRLVAEALAEREVLLNCAPHIVRPMRFVMPYVRELRPAWMIRAGLWLYDHLGRRQRLPGSFGIDLRHSAYGSGLKSEFRKGFVYSDCLVDDARLVVLNARGAADLGARILTRTRCIAARRTDGCWHARLRDEASGAESAVAARAVVNASGPWVRKTLTETLGVSTRFNVKLVQGSHIVVPRRYDGDHAFILQNDDRRVIFVYSYERDYTLIGTTDIELPGEPRSCTATEAEIEYLCRAVNRYLDKPVTPADVAWTYCGVRPLFDDGSDNPSQVTRDYTLSVNGGAHDAPVLSVFGGKITTYRKLAEHALHKLAHWFPHMKKPWTDRVPLPGGDVPDADIGRYIEELKSRHTTLSEQLLTRLAHRHGTRCDELLAGVHDIDQLGQHFGAELYVREIDWFIEHEWARSAEDVLWRRTKAGLHLNPDQQQAVAAYVTARRR